MPDFTCTVCGASFTVPDAALEKYPNWKPKYCRKHSPKKKVAQGSVGSGATSSGTGELNLTTEEVLGRFHEGPQSGIFTDGGARPNPGPGGWGFVYVEEGEIIEQNHGHDADTTNNRMELTALIEAYKIIPEGKALTVYSDSNLCVRSMNEWAPGWAKQGWKRKSGPIKNLALVKQLYQLYCDHPEVTLTWIKAHNGWLWNEYADSLATAWARETL